MKKNITIIDVAKDAGVSNSAVSRAFNPNGNCSADMRQRVMDSAKKLGYIPNRLARGMKSRSNLIGILISDFENPAYLPILQHFTELIQDNDCHSLLINLTDDMDIGEAIDLMMSYQLDGLVITPTDISQELIAGCMDRNIPMAFFGRQFTNADEQVASVYCDDVSIGSMAADLLMDAGYNFPAFVGGPLASISTIDRQHGFISRVIERGCKQWLNVEGGAYTYDAGYSATLRLFESEKKPDSFFYADDILACGGMDVLRYKLGYNIPEQIGIVGVDDIPLAASMAYDLTTIKQPFYDMAKSTIRMLFDIIDDTPDRDNHIFLPCELVARSSTRDTDTKKPE